MISEQLLEDFFLIINSYYQLTIYTYYYLMKKSYKISDTILGRGEYGTTYEAEDQNQKRVAAKGYPIKDKPNQFIKQIELEAQIMTKIDSIYIVRALDLAKTPQKWYLIMQQCHANLDHAFKERARPNASIIWGLFKKIYLTLLAITEHRIIKRVLNPKQLLIKNEEVKITDFIGAISIQNPQKTFRLKNIFVSPQILQGKQYSAKTDIWTLGVIFYWICCQSYPWGQYSENYLEKCFLKFKIQYPSDIPYHIQSVIHGCLQYQEENRIDIDGLYALLSDQQHMSSKQLDSKMKILHDRVINSKATRQFLKLKFKDEQQLTILPKQDKNQKFKKIFQALCRCPSNLLSSAFQFRLNIIQQRQMSFQDFYNLLKFIMTPSKYDHKLAQQFTIEIDADGNKSISYEQLNTAIEQFKKDKRFNLDYNSIIEKFKELKKISQLRNFFNKFLSDEENQLSFASFGKLLNQLNVEYSDKISEEKKKKLFEQISKGKQSISYKYFKDYVSNLN